MGERTSPSARYGKIDEHYAAQLATCPADDDGPIWMVNLMSYRDRAEYADDRGSEISGREADDRYTPLGPLAAIGAEIVFAADVDTQFLNPDPAWHRVAVVKYPTRRSFVEMSTRADFQELHHHKEAGMAHTFVIGCLPMPDVPFAPQGAVDWAAAPHPPTPTDPYVQVIHVLRFHDAQSVDEMSRYTDHAAKIAVPHGVRISAWLRAEGTIIGDGRTWDQVRFNTFPSKQAFLDVAFDPQRLKAQAEHREVALADTYTMILRPTLDRLHESITGERPAELAR